MFFRMAAVLSVASTFLVGPALAQSAVSAGAEKAYAADKKFQAAMKEAKLQERNHEMFFADDAYKKANKIAAGQCEECLDGMFRVEMANASYKDAIATAMAMAALAVTPADKAVASVNRGRALYAQAGEKPKQAQLEAADAAFKEALANYPKSALALYMDGQVLARMGRLEESKTSFEKCVNCVSANDPARLRAQHFAENPLASLKKMAPAFTVTALDGSKFTLDAMGGRVVLIDFWATWCGPCNEELPEMKRIAKEFAGQPLVIISVSWDSDEAKWKEFIAKHEMTWIQYRDTDHALTKSFGINSIPHYFTIDADGGLTSEMMGSGSDVEGKLKKLVAKAREAQAQSKALQAGGN